METQETPGQTRIASAARSRTEGCIRFIAKLGAASTLSAEDEQAIADLCQDPRSVPAKSHLIREGDNPHNVLLMMEGWAARYSLVSDGGRQITAILLPGDFCDLHVTILGRMDHSIIALTAAKVAFIPHKVMQDLPINRPEVARALWRATLIDEAVLRQWIVNIGRRTASERIAHLFCELHARLKLVGLVEDGQFDLPLSQDVIADALGLTNVHVNRMLKNLRAEGIIALKEGELTILDLKRLQKLAGFDASYLHREMLVKQ